MRERSENMEKENAAVQRERFDYTKWQREHFDDMDLHTFLNNAVEYTKAQGK